MAKFSSIAKLTPMGAALVVTLQVLNATSTRAQVLPEIRTHAQNQVPACVTPARLMQFLASGNARLPERYGDIARHYKAHGERLKVRWDYAFFQMILETNYLKFKNGAGQGDVDPRQNNFAGIGTTGGGVPGDAFPDVSTGVLAQMQHLIAYSGERVDGPVGRRTREKQDEIIQRSRMLGRPVTFRDLTRRWAVDRRYGSSIAFVAGRFRATHCTGRESEDVVAAAPAEPVTSKPERFARADTRGTRARRRGRGREPVMAAPTPEARGIVVPASTGPTLVQGPRPAERPRTCKVFTASYGGEKNVLIRAVVGSEMHYTALQVLDGMEGSLAQSFIRTHAQGGEPLGQFPTRVAALEKAFHLCPAASRDVK